MHIQSIQSFSYNKTYKQNVFRGCSRDYRDSTLRFAIETEGLISTYTQAFREDMEWTELSKVFDENFKDNDKVKLYSLACSDGSEAYTLAISLLENTQNPTKFFPITALDKDEVIIEFAKNKRINLSNSELGRIKAASHLGKEYFVDKDQFIKIKGETRNDNSCYSYSPIRILKDNIKFEQGDILDFLKKIEDNGNSIILCRNVFPYLSVDSHYDILKVLEQKLKAGSLFVIGQYDIHACIDKKLLNHGFEKISSLIFRKI